MPKYHLFFQSTKNIVDFTLAIVTCIIQLPFIKESVIYPYLTLFQILRVYRVIVAIPRLRDLLVNSFKKIDFMKLYILTHFSNDYL